MRIEVNGARLFSDADVPPRDARQAARHALRVLRRTSLIVYVFLAIGLGLAIAAYRSDTLAVRGSALSRRLIGSHNTVRLEAVYFRAEDAARRLEYRFVGGSESPLSDAVQQREPSPAAAPPSRPLTIEPVGPPAPDAPPASVPTLYSHTPSQGEGGWASVALAGPLLTGFTARHPVFTTFVRPDADRPYATVTLATFDAASVSLHLVAGTREPGGGLGVPGQGSIPGPIRESGTLIAAFNGGFGWDDGHYGMIVDGQVVVPMRDGLATLATYRDGSFHIGVWGRDVVPSFELVSARENAVLLLENGAISPEIDDGGGTWGWVFYKSLNFYTARSAIGFTADGRFVFAGGYSVNARTLSLALQRVGVVEAMQLDINSPYTQMALYEDAFGQLKGFNLANWMGAAPSTFFAGRARDFVYMTIR
jgi:hypothetical protein